MNLTPDLTKETIATVSQNMREMKLHDRIESAKMDVMNGLSYKAVSRKHRIPIALVKELNPRTTGRFFFALNAKNQRTLIAERVDVISGMSNTPKGAKLYYSAAEAYADTRGAR